MTGGPRADRNRTTELPRVAVVGGGPAGLMAAEVVSAAGLDVTLFERMPTVGRKLLIAGRGGLNLTHSEPVSAFRGRYGAASEALGAALDGFAPDALRRWCAELGIETFIGSSGRVFPVAFKTSPLLRAWLRRLDAAGVRFAVRHNWRGWDADGKLRFETPAGAITMAADAVILALGGASWPQLGSDGSWVVQLEKLGIGVTPLRPANCGFAVSWSETFRSRFEGKPLKNVAVSFAGQRARGDLVVTRAGLEGGPLYQLAPLLREAVLRDGVAVVDLALRPELPLDALAHRLARRQAKQSVSTALRKTINMPPVAISLLRETMEELPREADALARLINALPIRLTGTMPLAGAISTAGGIALGEVDGRYMLKACPATFVAGEMLDWEASTGGYLLQACFATGAAAGRGACDWLAARQASLAGQRATSC